MKLKKYFIVSTYKELNYKAGSNLVFLDEFIYHLYDKNSLKKYNCFKKNDIKYTENFLYKDSKFLENKVSAYKKQLTKVFNEIHNTKYSENYWGLIIHYWIYHLVLVLRYKYINLKKIREKYKKNLYINYTKFNSIFFSTQTWRIESLDNHELHHYLCAIIGKELGIEVIKKNKKEILLETYKSKISVGDYFLNSIIFLFRSYVHLFKPTTIIDGYFGKKNSFFIFLKSFGKVIFLPSKLFFYKRKYNFKINHSLRRKIKVKEKDKFDKIFNKIVGEFTPTTLVESYNLIKNENKNLSGKIDKIGSGIGILQNENFKIIAAHILLKKKSKLLIFQHGGAASINQKYSFIRDKIEDKYCNKNYYWSNKKGLGQHYFSKLDKIDNFNLKKNKRILIVKNIERFYMDPGGLDKSRHLTLNCNYDFFNNLSSECKSNTFVKFFPWRSSNLSKKFLISKFGKKINFLDIYSSKEEYYRSKLLIIDTISTAFYEALYIGIPFILIYDVNLNKFQNDFKQKLKELKKLNIIHSSAKSAAFFVNKNYNNLFDWWNFVENNKKFKKIKKNIINYKPDYITKIAHELK